MTTEVEQYDPADEVSTYTAPSTKGLQRLRAEVEAMKDAATMARGIAASGFVPDFWLKDKTEQQAIAGMASAILFGSELGLSAMRSVNELFIVRGKPAMYARTMAALVRAAGYAIEPVEESATKVVWRGFRDGKWHHAEWTMERAQVAGYTSNKLYQTNPLEMLRAKTITEVCRIAYQDVLLGLDYSMEELDLIDGVSISRPVKRKEGTRGLAALREIAEDAPAQDRKPPVDGVAGAVAADAPVDTQPADPQADKPVPPSANQQAEIRKLLKVRGVTGTGILDDLSEFMGATVKAFDQITSAEAAEYIDVLKSKVPTQPEA